MIEIFANLQIEQQVLLAFLIAGIIWFVLIGE